MPRARLAAFALVLVAGCNANSVTPSLRTSGASQSALTRRNATSPIEHVVVIIQENRTFNDFFATFPGADGSTTGVVLPNPACKIKTKSTIKLKESGLITLYKGSPHDLIHAYEGYNKARDGGSMDGFDLIIFGDHSTPECTFPYQYTKPSDIRPYWQMAKQYVLAEHMFPTQGSSSFTAHQDLIAGDTVISPNEALIDLPSAPPWGCDAPKGTRTSLITKDNVFQPAQGPYPCLTYPTLRDRLDAKGVTWRYYVPPECCSTNGKLLDAFDAIKAVREGSEWSDGHIVSQKKIFSDLTGHLQEVSWVIPDENDSDHPGTSSDTGPSWVASVVNAIGESSYWNSTAIVILWDDWGGLYDNDAPPQKGYGGLGFRVPAIIVSPYAKAGTISTTQYEFGSVLKYIEENFGLKSLKRTDSRATSIADCFNYSQKPILFQPIKAKYSRAHFLHAKPSYLPVDTDM